MSARPYIVDQGLRTNPHTGEVYGQHLELDENVNGHFVPLYYYNRSWRFMGLFTEYEIPITQQGQVLTMFEQLEKVWEREKSRYDRVYFLTQKVLLQEITQRLGIPSTQPNTRPISDKRRYQRQMVIFEDLWRICNNIKDVENACSCRRTGRLVPVQT
jgi:hypothetical protein